METTLILIKPDAIAKNLSGKVLAKFSDHDLTILGIKMMHLTDALLTEHYSHLATLPFFSEIVAFMQESPVIAVALKGNDAISKVRNLLGATDPAQATTETIRGTWGENKMRNVCHASDSVDNASIELKRFFQEGELFN